MHPLIGMFRLTRSLLPPCLLATTLLVAACDAREPLYVGDPEGVNRNGQPQVIIKQDEIRLNGFPIKQYRTRAADLIPIIGIDISSQASSDAYWNAMGLQIHAAPDDGALPEEAGVCRSEQVAGLLSQFDWICAKKLAPASHVFWNSCAEDNILQIWQECALCLVVGVAHIVAD